MSEPYASHWPAGGRVLRTGVCPPICTATGGRVVLLDRPLTLTVTICPTELNNKHTTKQNTNMTTTFDYPHIPDSWNFSCVWKTNLHIYPPVGAGRGFIFCSLYHRSRVRVGPALSPKPLRNETGGWSVSHGRFTMAGSLATPTCVGAFSRC